MSTPMRRIVSRCCPRAASGHAAAAPPSATNNSRRPMVTVIRPSRARCVKGTIPRHEHAVLTARHLGRGRAGGAHSSAAPIANRGPQKSTGGGQKCSQLFPVEHEGGGSFYLP